MEDGDNCNEAVDRARVEVGRHIDGSYGAELDHRGGGGSRNARTSWRQCRTSLRVRRGALRSTIESSTKMETKDKREVQRDQWETFNALCSCLMIARRVSGSAFCVLEETVEGGGRKLVWEAHRYKHAMQEDGGQPLSLKQFEEAPCGFELSKTDSNRGRR